VQKCFISLITDVYSRHVVALVLLDKRPSDHVISYMHRSKIETGRELQQLHTDGGKEYNRAEQVLQARGVKVTRTPVHTPQWNALSERKGGVLMAMTRALLLAAGADPDVFWRFAFETAVFVQNRTNVVSALGKTPHELFSGRKPDISRFRTFGCDAIVTLPSNQQDKIHARAQKGAFVGYDPSRELCYRIWVGPDQPLIVSRDVEFRENEFTFIREASHHSDPQGRLDQCLPPPRRQHAAGAGDSDEESSSESDSASSSASESASEDQVDPQTLRRIAVAERRMAGSKAKRTAAAVSPQRRSRRQRKQAPKDGLNLEDFGPGAFAVSATTVTPSDRIRASDVEIPRTRKQALNSPYASFWQAAMDEEFKSLQEQGVFKVVPRPPPPTNVVGEKWVFAVKADAQGWVTRFKAREVARGFSQQAGIDFHETYAPVLKYATLRFILILVATLNLTLELMDVQTAYLNAALLETVYMEQPKGFEQGGAAFVWQLLKSLYGLRQSGRNWHEDVHKFILSLDFTQLKCDVCLYVKRSRTGNLLLISLYVDDLPCAFMEVDRVEWEEIKQSFFDKYKIKFLGEAAWLLNLRITRDRSRKLIWLDQQAYVETMLEELQMDECRPVEHPGAQESLSHSGCPLEGSAEALEMKSVPYRRIVGLLIYLAKTSRPDISHAVRVCAQFSQNPGAIHWRAVKQILRYLAGTRHFALFFDGNVSGGAGSSAVNTPVQLSNLANSLTLVAFVDAD
jgi:hypothetical protein